MSLPEAMQLLKSGHPIRFHSWWWGRHVVLSGRKLLDQDGVSVERGEALAAEYGWEIYVEERHGAANDTN